MGPGMFRVASGSVVSVSVIFPYQSCLPVLLTMRFLCSPPSFFLSPWCGAADGGMLSLCFVSVRVFTKNLCSQMSAVSGPLLQWLEEQTGAKPTACAGAAAKKGGASARTSLE